MKYILLSPASRKGAEARERRRLKAAKLFRRGLPDAEIARRLGVTRVAVHKWHKVWKERGLKGLRSAGHPGPRAKLARAAIARVRAALLKGPRAAGYATDYWTLGRIQQLIRAVARVTYHPGHVWKILEAMGWSCQKPETRAKERNERAIKRWREVTWPALQKRGPKTAPALAF